MTKSQPTNRAVQIPEDLFIALVRYHWLDERTADLEEAIREGLSAKIDKMAAREMYAATLDKKTSL